MFLVANVSADFSIAMAEALSVDAAAITVDGIQAGSVVVDFSVLAAPEAISEVSTTLEVAATEGTAIAVGDYEADTSSMVAPVRMTSSMIAGPNKDGIRACTSRSGRDGTEHGGSDQNGSKRGEHPQTYDSWLQPEKLLA